MTEELELKKKLEKVLKQFGVWYYYPSERMFSDRRYPEMIATFKGRFFAFEFHPKYETSDCVSWDCLKDIKKTGAEAFIVRDETIKDIKKRFSQLQNENQHDELVSKFNYQ